MTLPKFRRDRNAALLSMDRTVILDYFAKYAGDDEYSRLYGLPADVFWLAIHKARTACRDLPMEERSKSKAFLIAHDSQPMDDGDVP